MSKQERDTLHEGAKPERACLVEVRASDLTILERAESPQAKKRYLVRVKGEFARSDVPTENGRVYSGQLWEREIKRLSPGFGHRRVYGELDHPDDGRTRLQRVSHIITDLRVENGIVVGEAEILNTARGRDLAALIEAGCQVGVSSRGYGSTVTNQKGESVVSNDYKLATFDFVADPADKTAYPEVTEDTDFLFEGLQMEEGKVLSESEGKSAEEARQEMENEIRLQLESEMKARLSSELMPKILSELESEIQSRVDEGVSQALEGKDAPELTEDVAVLKSAVATLTEEKSLLQEEVEKLQHENAELAEAAKDLGFRLYLERKVQASEFGDQIQELVGDLSQYASVDDFTSRVEEVEQHLQEQHEAQQAQDAERQALIERHQASQRALEEQVNQLKVAVEKASQAAHLNGLQAYIENRIARHPRRDNIRAVLEQVSPTTKSEVDQVIEQFRIPVQSREQIQEVSARVRSTMGGGVTALARLEETPWEPTLPSKRKQVTEDVNTETDVPRSPSGGFNGTGLDLQSLQVFMPPGADQ